MKRLINYTLALTLAVAMVACGGSSKQDKAGVAEKKTTLEKKKKELASLTAEIQKLEEELAKIDTAAGKDQNAKLVSITPLATQEFKHYIEIQGNVASDNISVITPRLGAGQVKAIYVKQGQQVSKGQLLLKMDDALIRQQITAGKSSLGTIQTQLTAAKDVLNRFENLRKQGIGSEVQLIQYRTNVNTLEAQLDAAKENIKISEEQLRATNVYSDVTGVAEQVNVRVGETFMGMIGNMPQIQIVNNSVLKVEAAVPETYAGKVKVGAPINVVLPDINKTFQSSVALSGKLINTGTRSFTIEAKIPSDPSIRPNQIAKIQIQDYAVKNTIVVPVNTVQTDEKGKYVFVAVKEGDRIVARKRAVAVGELNGQMIEVKTGLAAGDQLITEGYQNLYEGQVISIVK